MTDQDEAQALEHAARILLGLIESDEFVSLASIMERTELSKSTAAGLLRSLERYVFLACSAGGRDQSLATRDTSP
jgi:DNA-binding IclR family transcriptional regulator